MNYYLIIKTGHTKKSLMAWGDAHKMLKKNKQEVELCVQYYPKDGKLE